MLSGPASWQRSFCPGLLFPTRWKIFLCFFLFLCVNYPDARKSLYFKPLTLRWNGWYFEGTLKHTTFLYGKNNLEGDERIKEEWHLQNGFALQINNRVQKSISCLCRSRWYSTCIILFIWLLSCFLMWLLLPLFWLFIAIWQEQGGQRELKGCILLAGNSGEGYEGKRGLSVWLEIICGFHIL